MTTEEVPAPPDVSEYALHVEELMRFRRFVLMQLHVRPVLPADSIATVTLPDGTTEPLCIAAREDHSVISGEFLAVSAGQPVHEATVTIVFAGGTIRFSRIGVLNAPADAWDDLTGEFREYGQSLRDRRVLEIGRRSRGFREAAFPHPSIDYTAFDIESGHDVDVVGDAHSLSSYFPPESFDVVCSEWVFTHLLMPWRVVTEINRVLRPGGDVWINTNHSLAIDGAPWDFWRFSDTAWLGLFNEFTGFEIVKAALGVTMRLTPVHYADVFRDHEGGAGFQACCVWARKTAPSRVNWQLDPGPLLKQIARASGRRGYRLGQQKRRSAVGTIARRAVASVIDRAASKPTA